MTTEPQEGAEAADTEVTPEAGADDQPQEQAAPTIEDIAGKFGWKEGGKLSAAEFLDETPKIMDRQRKKLDTLGRAMRGYEAQLQGSQRQNVTAKIAKAIEEGDTEAAERIAAEVVQPGASEFTAFKERNDWFNTDPEATAYAEALDRKFAPDFGPKDPVTHFAKIEEAVRKRFPEHFDEPKAEPEPKPATKKGVQPFSHGASRVTAPKPATVTGATLTPAQRKAADDMGVSHDSYAKSVNELAEKDRAA